MLFRISIVTLNHGINESEQEFQFYSFSCSIILLQNHANFTGCDIQFLERPWGPPFTVEGLSTNFRTSFIVRLPHNNLLMSTAQSQVTIAILFEEGCVGNMSWEGESRW